MLTKTPLLPIILMLIASVLGAIGQFLFQIGSKQGKGGIVGFLIDPFILLGMGSYILVMVMFTQAFRLGGTVRVLYPLYASTFIWAALIAWFQYDQAILPIHVMGMILLIVGMIFMSW